MEYKSTTTAPKLVPKEGMSAQGYAPKHPLEAGQEVKKYTPRWGGHRLETNQPMGRQDSALKGHAPEKVNTVRTHKA